MLNIPLIVSLMLWASNSVTASTILVPPYRPKSHCSNLSFHLPITYDSLIFTSPPDPTDEIANGDFVQATLGGVPAPTNGTRSINGTFTINAVYCRPHSSFPSSHRHIKDRKALQILVHGITYNRDFWAGFGLGDQYNWHAAANAEGYHTLAIDRVGHGPGANTSYNGQSFPDPLTVVQSGFHVESIFQLITTIRTHTKRNAIGKGFDKIIYVGHSYGSFLGTSLASLHPSAIDALILTGYSTSINLATASVYKFIAASSFNPQRFPASQPLGYVTISTLSARKTTFFSGLYDPTIPPIDFALSDTITTGESATLIRTASVPVTGYQGPVFIATGEEDYIFCHTEGKTCETILQETLAGFFPEIGSEFKGYFVPQKTGHCLGLHYSAPETTRKVNKFLGRFF